MLQGRRGRALEQIRFARALFRFESALDRNFGVEPRFLLRLRRKSRSRSSRRKRPPCSLVVTETSSCCSRNAIVNAFLRKGREWILQL